MSPRIKIARRASAQATNAAAPAPPIAKALIPVKDGLLKGQALQAIAFAAEVLKGLEGSAGQDVLSKTRADLRKAQELADNGEFFKAAKLANQTAEALLIGGAP